ncbi:hypothetical protein EJ04DRAFT_245267 [Polyplosphaeria fusca]|uniref:Uncharacterized protein n=1 Tax=Polyplosphaeria fusca TaxID=682080 RepID=A0A9P4R115_9PLEO|nr:hypothetical protein EJ04DRAFT_245267 [Polyplosphaeria fusca]
MLSILVPGPMQRILHAEQLHSHLELLSIKRVIEPIIFIAPLPKVQPHFPALPIMRLQGLLNPLHALLLPKLILPLCCRIHKLEPILHGNLVPLFIPHVEVRHLRLRHRDRETHGVSAVPARLLYNFRNRLQCLFDCLDVGFGDGFPEAEDPCAEHGHDFASLIICEFAAPFGYGWDLVDPDGEFGLVVAGADGPGVRQAGRGVGDDVWGGTCEVCCGLVWGVKKSRARDVTTLEQI